MDDNIKFQAEMKLYQIEKKRVSFIRNELISITFKDIELHDMFEYVNSDFNSINISPEGIILTDLEETWVVILYPIEELQQFYLEEY